MPVSCLLYLKVKVRIILSAIKPVFVNEIQYSSNNRRHKLGSREGHPDTCHVPEVCKEKGNRDNQDQSPKERDDLCRKCLLDGRKVHRKDDIESRKHKGGKI